MKLQSAAQLKPTEKTISQFKTLKFSEKYGKKMIYHFSVYLEDGVFIVAQGFIFNVRQEHKVVMKSKNYNEVVKFLNAA